MTERGPRHVVAWPWWLWILWFMVTACLTLIGIGIAAIGCVIWLIGAAVAIRWPEAGADVKEIGTAWIGVVALLLDKMNGHA